MQILLCHGLTFDITLKHVGDKKLKQVLHISVISFWMKTTIHQIHFFKAVKTKKGVLRHLLFHVLYLRKTVGTFITSLP